MFKTKLEKLLKDDYTFKRLPETILIPAPFAGDQEVVKPIAEATIDDLVFAAQALDKQSDALTTRLYAIRRLYKEARSKGALGEENILDALARKGGDQ